MRRAHGTETPASQYLRRPRFNQQGAPDWTPGRAVSNDETLTDHDSSSVDEMQPCSSAEHDFTGLEKAYCRAPTTLWKPGD